ncbi:hypothetical protein [Bartonella tamiae]|uniref:Uncharacterized protein n=1 Tax=Bartonella tamiae Th239 TaxID=1094558 RepID=J0ZLQ3_9HYPH|nr:hypothetical protein [Bartonella tamiae]EJF89353.1 hypothetical protein ME5_01904 [Bartonella tamiae Th239]EJF92782.1 hypothetical protein MEG_01952 [Bartonella tamiae Th307]
MLYSISEKILDCAGYVAAFFISPDAINFNFIQLGVVLLMLIAIALVCWFIPFIFRHHNIR